MSSISGVFERTVLRKDFGPSLERAVNRFYNEFITRSDGLVDHAGFFGSGYIGVHKIRWLPSDTKTFWQEVLDGEIEDTRPELIALPTVNEDHNVASDPTNLAVVWLVHKVMTNNKLSEKSRKKVGIQLLSILYFKNITSIITTYFSYGADPQLAIRCYEAMSYKFDLKVYKTWGRLIEARATAWFAPGSIHLKTFMLGQPDEAMMYVATDIKTRCNLMIQAITALYYKVREENDRVVSLNAMFESEDGMAVRDVKRGVSDRIRYLNEIITDPASFIRADLLKVVLELNPSAQAQLVVETLEYISSQYGTSKGQKIKSFVDEVMRWSFALLHSRGIDVGDLLGAAEAVKGLLNASRNKESDLLHIRKEGERIVRLATKRPTNVVVSGERTAVAMYILLRSLTERYFN